MRFAILLPLAAALATAVPAAAALVQISGSGTYGEVGVPSSHAVSNATYSFRIRFDSPFGINGGGSPFTASSFVSDEFRLNGVLLAEPLQFIDFYAENAGGGFDLAYASDLLNFFGADIGNSGTLTVPFSGSFINSAGGTADVMITAVPEPATWALMIGGFAGVGIATRRQRRRAVVASAS